PVPYLYFSISGRLLCTTHANENSDYGAQGSYTDDKGNSLSSATIIDLYEMVENDNVYACFELWKRFHNDAGQGETVLQALTRAAEIILQDPSAYPSDIASVIFREAGKLVLSDDQEKGFELPGTHQAPPLLCSLTGSRSRKRLAHRLHFAQDAGNFRLRYPNCFLAFSRRRGDSSFIKSVAIKTPR
ncbi:MAG: hypothetical protein LIO86_13935, partial [Lachnospiraceae bacterium]|nr:hypothetical protein [Lachnospiraceae bacterium]